MNHDEGIPAVLGGQALRALRDSGYSLAAALAEPIDNSLEANANNITVVLEDEKGPKGRKQISRVIISDDGDGMAAQTLQYYPQLGYSTRFMSQTTIGKFGVGAKLAALSVSKRMEVYSRQSLDAPWLRVHFDLEEAMDQEKRKQAATIAVPLEVDVPFDLESFFPSSGVGTVVIWSKVDRLEEGGRTPDINLMRAEIVTELSRVFRYFLHGGINIELNGIKLVPHDPMFLMDQTWADQELSKYEARHDDVPRRPDSKVEVKHYPAMLIADETMTIGHSKAQFRLTLYPSAAIRPRFKGGDELARRLRIPDNEGCVSFVRLNREINYTLIPKLFHRAIRDKDRYFGIEVTFNPELDEHFGVRNVKRGVEPNEQLRTELRKLLQQYLPTAEKRLEEVWAQTHQLDDEDSLIAPIVSKAVEVNRTLPKPPVRGPVNQREIDQKLTELAEDVGKTTSEEKQAYVEERRKMPFVLEQVSFPGKQFIDIQHINGQAFIRLNTRHRFYRELWEPIKELCEAEPSNVSPEQAVQVARRSIEALTLLLLAYGRAETMHENPEEQYVQLRDFWGTFLDQLMSKVKGV